MSAIPQKKPFAEYMKYISYMLLAVGLILILLSMNNYSNNGLYGASIGYTIIMFSILILMLFVFIDFFSNSGSQNTNTFSKLISFIFTMYPFFLLTVALIMSLLINNFYFTKLTTTTVSSDFNKFTNMSIIFITIQSLLVIYILANKEPNKSIMTSMNTQTSVLSLIGVMNIVSVICSFITLKYFTTDG